MEASPDFSSKRFLVVDDVPYMIETIAEMLRRHKAGRIFRAAGAEAAQMLLETERGVDCVISDFNMTPLNGVQLLASIRTGAVRNVSRDQRFVLVTGHGEAEVVKAALALDVSGYVVKPVALATLMKTLERAFSRPLKAKSAAEYKAVPAVISRA